MGGILSPSKEAEILKYIRHDEPKKLQNLLVNNNLKPDDLYTNRHRTLIQLCCYFSSPKCLSKLIEMNCDYNKKEVSNNYSPLYIACKFNSLDLVKILLSKEDIQLLQKSNDGLNELEISFIKGNYGICYYLLYEYKKKTDNEEDKFKEKMIININRNKKKKANDKDNEDEKINIDINTKNNEIDAEVEVDMNQPYQNFFFTPSKFDIEKYNSLQASNQCPLFNMPLFYDSLCRKTPPEKCVSFAAERKRTKELLTKIPDPNETWGHFFKRLANLELYNPPLVDKRNVTQMNSLYMNAQMKLLEKEYGVKMSYYNQNEDDTRNILDEDNNIDDDLIKIQSTEKKKLKIKNSEQDIINNNIEEDENNENVIKINANKNQKNPEEIKIGGKESVIALNIENSSDRNIKKDEVEDKE